MSQANQIDIYQHYEENRKEEEQFKYVFELKHGKKKPEFKVECKNIKKPENIYKFYGFENHHIDAFIEGYLYAAHPFELNDVLDCNSDLVYSSKRLHRNEYVNLYKSANQIDKLYNNDKKNIQFISDALSILSNIYGIISLTAEKNHPLMWAHYAQEKGFQIKFKTKELEEGIQKNLKKNNEESYGFFPINYVAKLKPIDIYGFNHGINVPFLYLTNVKLKNWSYENEWRLIVNKELMGVPNSERGFNMFPEFCTDKKNRYAYYNKSAIEEICVGNNFFSRELFEIKPIETGFLVKPIEDTKEEEKLNKFLKEIAKNFNDCFYMTNIRKKKDNESYILKRVKQQLKITKENDGFYMLTRTNKIIDEHE